MSHAKDTLEVWDVRRPLQNVDSESLKPSCRFRAIVLLHHPASSERQLADSHTDSIL
ncbi:hypothetical protein EXN66_Car000380 [Channa argus]|uniref:Uncharacterized protein n=1 Tax=Channa argus TaxID=215402 RepID=A0A6G1QXJ7_CHAAH|nr:hypothetical protein EXN66_Car000380 [Channa argus]